MNRRARRCFTLPAVLLTVTLAGTLAPRAAAQARVPGQTAYVLDDREAAVKALAAIDKAIVEKRLDAAANGILALLFQAGDDVAVASPELHVGLREHARSLMTTLPAPIIQRARGRRAGEAAKLLERARATGDEKALWRLVTEFSFTAAAAAALEELADRALERGDNGLAHRAFRRYLRYYRPRAAYADLPWTRLLAKAGAAAAAVNDAAALAAVQRAAKPLADRIIPVGGKTERLGPWLATLTPRKPDHRVDHWLTYGGAATRARRPSRPSRYYRCRWVTVDLPRIDPDVKKIEEGQPHQRSYTPIRPTFPVTDGKHIFYFNGRQLGVYRLADGKLVGETVFRPSNPGDRSYWPFRFRHVTVGARHVFAVTEDNPDFMNIPTQRVLHAFSLPGPNGKLVKRWTRGGENDPDALLETTSLTGSPLVVGDTIYMAGLVRGTDDRAYLFAFEAATGRVRWHRFLCAGAGQAAQPRFQRTVGADDSLSDPGHGETMVAAARGVVYVSTNQGVVAAVARGDGELLWLHRYPRRRRPQNPSLWPAVTPLPWQDYPILVADDRVVLTPRDSDRLHVLATEPDRARGLVRVASVRKTSPDAEMLYLIGATRDRAYFTERRWVGEQSIFRVVCLALGAAPSQEVWSFEIPHVRRAMPTPTEFFTGRALLTREFVLVPTNKHVYGLDAHTGRRTFQLSISESMKDSWFNRFGNVIPAGLGFLCSYADGMCWWGPGRSPGPAGK